MNVLFEHKLGSDSRLEGRRAASGEVLRVAESVGRDGRDNQATLEARGRKMARACAITA